MSNNSSVDNIQPLNLFLNILERATKAGLDAEIVYNTNDGVSLCVHHQNLGVTDYILYLDSTEAEFDTVSEYLHHVEEGARLIKLGKATLSKLSHREQESVAKYILSTH
jgi:hypothetical protein